MTVTKEIRFSVSDVRELTIEALKKAAFEKLGEPKDDEEIIIDLSEYRSSVVTIQTKAIEETKEVNK